MVQRSDDKGDKRSQGKTAESGASRDVESNAANALRERIREAGAATVHASDDAPPQHAHQGLVVPNSSSPPAAEHSGIHTRPPEPRPTSITPPLFGAPRLSPDPMSVPWPAKASRRRDAATRMGLGPPVPDADLTPQSGTPIDVSDDPGLRATERISLPVTVTESGPAPRGDRATPPGIGGIGEIVGIGEMGDPGGIGGVGPPPIDDDWVLSNARTLEMPRVKNGGGGAKDDASMSDLDERRRAELATTRKTQGLLRSPDGTGSNAGRYSVHDVSTEYVDTGSPGARTTERPTADADDRPEVTLDAGDVSDDADAASLEGDTTRPRRSTPKQRVGHRRSSRPEIGHARERGTKRTDPGIRARTLRGGAAAANKAPGTQLAPANPQPAPPAPPVLKAQLTPLHPPRPRPLAPGAGAPRDPGSVVIDPSLTQPAAPLALPVKHEASSYVPLPRDREAYEAFLRSAAGEHGGPPRARPSWAQQETALIPRDVLEPRFEDDADRAFWRGPWFRGVLGVVLIVVSAAVLWWILREDRVGKQLETVPSVQFMTDTAAATSATTAAGPSAGRTLIATEPNGAELLLDNAVIGNTPFEVQRPQSGEVLYMVRFRNFEHQMVRITSATHDAIYITLVPVVAAPPPQPQGSRRR